MKKNNIPGFVELAPVVLTLILGLSSVATAANYDATYDLFCNDCIDWQDIGAFTDEWLGDCNLVNNWCGGADFSEDGKVDFVDFGLLGQYWWSGFLDEPEDVNWLDVMSSENLQNWQQPAKLDEFVGVHPRYLLTAADVTALKSKIASAGTYQDIWLNVVKPKADNLKSQNPPSKYWDEDDMRDAGQGIPYMALAYLLTEDSNYLDGANHWMTTICGYPEWDGDRSLGAAQCLWGVSIGYDWLYGQLSVSDRNTIRDKLIYQCGEMAANPAQKEVWLANHNHVEHSGLAAAGFVLYGESGAGDANDWIRQADLVFQTAFMVGNCEGSNTEGHPYWGYSMESLLCYTEAARDLMGKDYYDRNWVERATDFIIFCTLPDFNMISASYSNCVMSYGDSYRDYRSHGPTTILCRLASEYDNGYAQWLAEEMIDIGIGFTDIDYMAWANLLWYDEAVTPVSLSSLPTFKHFDDIGLVVSRSKWDNDVNAVMVGFKCGPMHGHKVQPYYEKQHAEASGYHTVVNGHCQPDVGSFQVYAYGKWLATEPGYSKYTYTGNKWTYDHCTMLAGGLGQWGEGGSWFDREDVIDANASSSIIKAESCADYDYIIGDAENIYRSGSLSKFLRHFVYIKPNLILIADELEASPSSDYFEWRLRATYPRSDFPSDVNIVKENDDYYVIENNNDSNDIVVMDAHFVHPGLTGFSTSVEELPKNPGKSNAYKNVFLTAEFDSTSGGDLLATVLHPRRDEDPNSTIISSSFADSVLSLRIGIGTDIIDVNLDLANQQVYCYGPASNPSPSSLATGVSVNADLSWTAGSGTTSHDVYFGTAYPPAFQTNLTDTTIFDPGVMNHGATYYWRINEKNASGTMTGTVWAFITEEYPTAPEQATNPSPSHEANDVSINADLSWTAGTGATLHNVYFGTANPPTFQGTQGGTIFEPGTMGYETTYYWRIDEKNVNGTTTGEIWQFTTEQEPQPPAQAGNPGPSDEATEVSTTADLSWTAGTGATSHDVYFGTSYPPAFQTNLTDTTIFDPGVMNHGTTYYWRIDEKNANGTTGGDVWEFTTETEPSAPEQATEPSPLHEATNVSVNASLSWVAGYGATSHDVYFGTASPPEFRGNVTDTTFYPGIMMEYETTYYWRIDEKNVYGTTTGNVWSFTTGGDFPDVSWDTIMSQAWHPPARLNDFIGVHPRYLLTQAEVNDLKIKINSAGAHRDIWLDVVKPKADSYLGTSPPWRYWDEDEMRDAGRGIPWMALAYLMTDDTDYLDSAKEWLTTVCGYPNWQNDTSLGAAEALVGVSIGYDWLYGELSILEKQTIKDKLILQAERMASNPVDKEVWLANHNHVGHNGLAAAGFVLYGEVSEAIDWIEQADLVFQTALLVGSDDGSSTEGHQYWGYSMESLLCYTEAARDLMDKDYYDRNWLKHATDFIIFSTIPDFDMIPGEPGYANCVMSFGDSYRDYRSHGPTHILCRLASEYNNGFAQWLADGMLERGVGLTDIDYRAWANLLWYDETVTGVSLSGLPTFKHFDDIGWVTSRSSWDEDAVMVGFKCGPMHGHKVQPYYERQYNEGWGSYHTIVDGHGHPDVGSFQIYAYGKWLATEPGYSKYTSSGRKYTYDHCTILANGLGQFGEGSTWFGRDDVIDANASSSIIKVESCADYDYIVGDAENIYRDPGLSKFYRHFIYIKPDFILIVDELEASPSSNYFQWRLRTTHERSQFVDDMNIDKVNNDYYVIENNNDSDVVVMDVHFIHPELEGFSTGREGDEFLVAGFNSTGSDLLATLLHPRRSWNNASEIVSSSFSGSVIDLTIGCGNQEINFQLDLAEQQVVYFGRYAASNPSPSDGATDVGVTADLSWTAGSGATSHNVYFGTSENEVNDATDPCTLPGRGNQSGTTFDPGTMDYGATYYWRIDEVAPAGTTIGDVWRFTTELPSPSSDWLQQDKLTALDGDVNDAFGCSVSISGDYAIVGAYVDDEMTGSAYIFKRGGTSWTEQTKLAASDGEAGDRFGYCVSINGDYAIVGAWGDDGYTGSAYIFKRDGVSWTEQAKLTASDGAYRDYFGWSVSISGDYAIVGAWYDDTSTGSAYIFKRDGENWTEQTKLTASDGAYRDCFGRSVSISGDYAVVGADCDDDNGNSSGSAYIFKRDGTIWTEQDKLTASDGAYRDYFGRSVSISGDYAVVGAHCDDDNGDGSGSAYIFRREGTHWSQQDKLSASDGTDEDYFGVSVSVDGDYAVVGAYYGDGNEVDSGSAYVFKRDDTIWAEQGKLTPSDGETEDYFGWSVSISGDYVLVGAQGDDDNGSDSGSAYFFVNVAPPVISDRVFSIEICQGWNYGDPTDENDLAYQFRIEIETDDRVNLVEFLTPEGGIFEIPDIVDDWNDGTWTTHEYDSDGDVWVWEYCREKPDLGHLQEFGDGWYTVRVYYQGGGEGQTNVWFGIPDMNEPIPQPIQEPVLTFPAHNGATLSPVAFTWQSCTDANTASIWLGLEKETTFEEVENDFSLTDVNSGPIALDKGMWEAELCFDHWYDCNNLDGIPVAIGKYSESAYRFEILTPPVEIEVKQGSIQIVDDQSAPIDFGSVVKSSSAQLTFTINNLGSLNLDVGTVVLYNNNGFEVAEQPATTVAPDSSTTFKLRMLTNTAGSKSADVQFSNNDIDENPFNFKVSGKVTRPQEITVLDGDIVISYGQDTPINIGASPPEFPGPSKIFTIRNDGNEVLTLTAPFADLPHFIVSDPDKTELNSGEETTFSVTLMTAEDGTFAEELSIGNNDSDKNPFNFSVEGTVAILPDLTVQFGTTRLPLKVVSGDGTKIKLPVLVKNIGNVALAKGQRIDIEIFARPASASDDSQDVLVGTLTNKSVSKLKPGRTKKITAKIYLPAGLVDDDYVLVVKVDSSNEVNEEREDNNTAVTSASIEVAKGYVDLTVSISSKAKLPSEVISGDGTKIKLPVLVKNDGNVALAKGQRIDIEIFARPASASDDSQDELVETLTNKSVSKLKPGKTKKITAKIYLPAGLADNYVLVVKVDSSNDVDEEREDNNTAVTSTSIEVTKGYVDLTVSISSKASLPSRVISGGGTKIKLPVLVKNDGNIRLAKGQRIDIEIFARPASASDDSQDVLVETLTDKSVSKLKPGKTKKITAKIYLPAGLADDDYVLVVKVDSSDKVDEEHEDNNTAVTSASIEVHGPYTLEDLRHYDVLGAWWEYDGGEVTLGVSGSPLSIGGHECTEVICDGGEGTGSTYWYTDTSGTHLERLAGETDLANFEFTIDLLRVAPPVLSFGQTYTDTSGFTGNLEVFIPDVDVDIDNLSGTVKSTCKLVRDEWVTVPMPPGTFNAVRAEQTYRVNGTMDIIVNGYFYTSGRVLLNIEETWWGVPDVGIVKSKSTMTIKLSVTGVGSESRKISETYELTDY